MANKFGLRTVTSFMLPIFLCSHLLKSLMQFKYPPNVVFTGKLCNRPLGMQNGRIRNAAITSSSRWDNKHAPHLARLHNRRRGSYMGGWSARINNAYQWLQIDLLRSHKVVRVSTQGRPGTNQWVTSYYLLYSQDGVYFASYFERNTRKVSFYSDRLFLILLWCNNIKYR